MFSVSTIAVPREHFCQDNDSKGHVRGVIEQDRVMEQNMSETHS